MKKTLLMLLVALGAGVTQAQVSASGEFESNTFGYFSGAGEDLFSEGLLTLNLEARSSSFGLVLKPQLRLASDFTDGIIPFREGDDLPTFTFNEVYIEAGGSFKLRAGKLIEKFCLSDESPVCPADGFNPRDMIDPFTGLDKRIGVPAISLRHTVGRSEVRIARSFGNNFSRLPHRDSRWGGVPEIATEVRDESELPGNTHASVKRFFSRGSVGIVFSRGTDYSPRIRFMPSPYAEDWTILLNSYQKRTATVLQMQFDWGTTMRFSGGYVNQGGSENLEYVIEFEAQEHRSKSSISMLGGYIGALRLDEFGIAHSESTRFRQGFFNSLFGGIERTTDSWVLRFGLVGGFYGFAMNPKATYTTSCGGFCEFVEIELAGLLLEGAENNLFGRYSSNDRVALKAIIGF